MKIKKTVCFLLAVAMIWAMVSCATGDNQVTTLTNPPTAPPTSPTEPSGDAEPDPTGPATPTDPIVPTDPSEPTGPVDPVDPSDPTGPSEPDVPEHQHSYAEEVSEATCIEDGFTTYTCECGDTYTGSKVAAIGHAWSEWTTIEEPTQATTGLAGRNCTVCGEKETKELAVVIPDHTHSYTGEVTKAATCSAEGVKTFTCSCGSSYAESIAKISHSYKDTVTAPTCTAKGYTTYKCSSCGDTYMDIYVAAIGHKFTSYKSNSDATCIQDGTKTATCSNGCGKKNTITDTGSAKGHSYKETVTAPTCTAQGYSTYKCGTCGDSYKGSYVAAAGHKYGTYASNGDATCTKDGTKTATCSACGTKDTVTDAGSMKDHAYSKGKVVEPTLWSTGYTVYACDYCADSYNGDQREVTAEEKELFLYEVENAVAKYINLFREEQGDATASVLPGMRQVTKYRAVQIETNFAHDTDDIREAHAYFEYGKWIDATLWGDDASDSYWSANATEAIAYTPVPSADEGDRSPDYIGYKIATQIRNSSGHWSYVGASRLPYMAVGVWVAEHDGVSFGGFYTCVMLSTENHG